MTDLTIVLRSLSVRRFSTAVVVALVAISAGLLLAILSLRSAGERAFERGTGNAHLLVSRDGSPLVSVLNGLFYANPPKAPIERAKLDELRASFPWAMFVPTAIGDSYRTFPVVATTLPSWSSRGSATGLLRARKSSARLWATRSTNERSEHSRRNDGNAFQSASAKSCSRSSRSARVRVKLAATRSSARACSERMRASSRSA
jgi:hypothetical protein